MAYIDGEGRNQGTLFPMVLDDHVPPDHMCPVIDAFVEQHNMEKLGFKRGRPPRLAGPNLPNDPAELQGGDTRVRFFGAF